jgi:hypothetical protein
MNISIYSLIPLNRQIYSAIFIGAQWPMNVMGGGPGHVTDRWPDIFIGELMNILGLGGDPWLT